MKKINTDKTSTVKDSGLDYGARKEVAIPDTTTGTIITGPSSEVFWEKYKDAILYVIQKKRKGKGDIPESELGLVYEKIRNNFHTYVLHGPVKFRACLMKWIGQAISNGDRKERQYSTRKAEGNLGTPQDEESGQSLVDRTTYVEWTSAMRELTDRELKHALIFQACKLCMTKYPWNVKSRAIAQTLQDVYLSEGIYHGMNKDIASKHNCSVAYVCEIRKTFDNRFRMIMEDYARDGIWLQDKNGYIVNDTKLAMLERNAKKTIVRGR